ncbi:Phosphoribosylaminoimidazole-succinocarboxamide synthase [Dehalobacter sp. UNSWDHB]|uniref:phosphoribosylaminoimidazolesuccinocarboxamide synthase n=1 Tax=unclassified Dehalobacter TaxID=2635733 RepID=UPI00038756D2|nr:MULTISPECIES: phosphoribosylaminoimidazolesuccinocarboxamide synthase [unclassified Dehalobacter]EQB22494.1 Phosphoribosylaminoimidazole-succinocarboxamide synthase [Dehalobacter sp. UNSWDHB]OCZ49965.1 phosphoribosylaminoimidazolesuccinocarboxamide synthase [Dehalobacter sp. TeCB1]
MIHEDLVLDLPLLIKGKVRDVYDLKDKLLIVVTDRISAFDVVFPNKIPNKGMVLNKISEFWFNYTEEIVKNHMITTDVNEYPEPLSQYREYLQHRSMLVKKVDMVKAECIVRGYLTGSALKEYEKTRSICGIKLPEGLMESSKLPEPIFTPTTKAHQGHDENITTGELENLIGKELTQEIMEKSLSLYARASKYAESRGLILADSKFEFGLLEGKLILADELFTPDSSRFWLLDEYEIGKSQKSFDKQFVRDYLENIGWNKTPPAPNLPNDVISQTERKYLEAYEIITGIKLV